MSGPGFNWQWGRPAHQGPPPWVTGLFGLAQGDQRRAPRARRGDVRMAILEVVRATAAAGETVNGYQVIQQITDRSGGVWRPSPGSVYPTIQQLQDEGLLETDDERARRTLRLTATGEAYVAAHHEELAGVWAPFQERGRSGGADFSDLKPEIGQVMSAVWQILTNGSPQQRRAAVDILVETRRKLYAVLGDGQDADEDPDGDPDEDAASAGGGEPRGDGGRG